MPEMSPMTEAAPVAIGPVSADGAARRALLRRLMDVVALPSSRGNVQDRAIAGDLLLEILIESDVTARELCARRLQDMSQTPKRLLRFLALDAPHVARLILAENKAFDEADLTYVVQQGSAAHRAAVAARRDLGPAVSMAIADSGDAAAMKVLLENNNARLGDRAVEVMVSASRKAQNLVPLLIQREELRPAQALAMFWWSGPPERKAILLRFSAERTLLIDVCSDIFRYAADEKWSDPVVRKALQIIERRQRDRTAIDRLRHESLEAAISTAAAEGLGSQLMHDIAQLSGVRASTGEQIFTDAGGEGIAILCKATGLKREYLRELWKALRRTGPDAELAFGRVSDVYEMIAVAKAQTVLRYWNWSLSSAYTPDPVDDVAGLGPATAGGATQQAAFAI